MRRIKGLAAALAISVMLTGCNWVSMPGGSFTTMSDKTIEWLEEEYGYDGSRQLTDEMAHAWELKYDLNGHLYEKYYLEDDYRFLCITELFTREGCLVWQDGGYTFCYKDGKDYRELRSEDGHRFVTEDGEEFWTEQSPDRERFDDYEYRMEMLEQ